MVLGTRPVELEALLARRRAPGDETWDKFDFYARAGVDEICVADPLASTLRWFVLVEGRYQETGESPLLGATATEISSRIDWPG